MVVVGQKVVVFEKKGICIYSNWLYFGKLVVFGEGGCIWSEDGCIWAKGDCIWSECFYLGKLVLFRQGGCIWAKGGCIWSNWFYLGKVVAFGKRWLYLGK